jgi:hypothetical protein
MMGLSLALYFHRSRKAQVPLLALTASTYGREASAERGRPRRLDVEAGTVAGGRMGAVMVGIGDVIG